ncbi:MAG: hypothetical protein AVDCRST_MAG61-2752, partial [uncultured Friedmanniella sp.]
CCRARSARASSPWPRNGWAACPRSRCQPPCGRSAASRPAGAAGR